MAGYPTTKTRAFDAGVWIPWRAAATFGPAAVMRSARVSSPLTTYLSWQGVLPVGVGLKQSWEIDENPMSLPPMVIDTTLVAAASESNWGGFGPSGRPPCAVGVLPGS